MKLTFIGTGSGKAELKHYHTSFFLHSHNFGLLIDCGDAVSKALLNSKINFNSISHILITHNHPDHFSGLPNLINQMYLTNRKKKLIIYTHNNLIQMTKNSLLMNYIFSKKLKFELEIKGFDYKKKFNVGDSVKITPIRNNHIQNKYKTRSISKNYFVSSSFLINNFQKSLLITSDLRDENDLELFSRYFPNILIMESTHLNFDSLSNFEIIKNTGRIFLTHYDNKNLRQIQKLIAKTDGNRKSKFFIAAERQKIII